MRSSSEQIHRLTLQFSQTVCATLRDMLDIEYIAQESTLSDEPFSTAEGMIAFVHFGGTIQGECILALSSDVVQQLLMILKHKIGDAISAEGCIGDLINEVLNASVGRLMPFLEKEFEAVTYMSPIIISGHAVFPKVASNTIAITGEPGVIKCVVALNRVSQKINQTLQSLSEALVQKTELVYIDSLTRLKNRRFLDEVFVHLVDSAHKTGAALSILLIDIDNFKSINDLLGHQTGDTIIKTTAQSIQESIRELDIACRYGGDEIVVILPDTKLCHARMVAQRIQKTLCRNCLTLKESAPVLPDITLSIGITQVCSGDTIEQLFRRADSALYTAKRNGRNRIESLQTEMPETGVLLGGCI